MPKHDSTELYVQGKPEGSFGRTAQDGHLDSNTAPELWEEEEDHDDDCFYIALFSALQQIHCARM